MKISFSTILILLIFFNIRVAYCQTTLDSTNVNLDTIQTKPLSDFVKDTKVEESNYQMTKSPTKAILYSFLLPGLGQYYVESYWKIPIFTGAFGTLAYLAVDSHIKYAKYQDEWDAMADSDQNKYLWDLRKEYFRNIRDKFIFFAAGVYIITAVDAYVGAHLFDFSVSDDLSMNFNTIPGTYYRMTISFNW